MLREIGNCLGKISKCFLHMRAEDKRQKSECSRFSTNLHRSVTCVLLAEYAKYGISTSTFLGVKHSPLRGPNEYKMLSGLETLCFFKGWI